MPALAIAGATLVGGVIAADSQRSAANKAADAQKESADAGIAEQRRQFDAIQQLLSPYVQAGTGALGGQQDLLGLGGPAAQQRAIEALQASPQFGALVQQGENAIMQNASATGGLRGGNVQAALGQFRPQILSALIDQQFNRLGGLTSVGQNAAAMTGNAGMQTGRGIADLLQQQGAASAGASLAAGRSQAGMWNSVGNAVGLFGGLGGFGGGGAPPTGYYGMDGKKIF